MKRVFAVFLTVLTVLCLAAGCAPETPPESDPPATPSEPAGPYQFRSAELEKYAIVYADDNPDYFDLAYQLSDRIYTQYGKLLTTVRDTNSTPTEYEILLGDTNRSDHTANVMEYSVTVEDGMFRINVGGSFSAEKAVDFLCRQLFNGQEFALENGEYYHTSFLTGPQELEAGASVRIMTANILADAFAGEAYQEAYYRGELFAGMLVAYTPDVVGLQEADESWSAVLDGYLAKLEKTHGIAYARLLPSYQDKVNYTSLIYRSDKFRAGDSGVNVFRWWTDGAFRHNYHMRNISWARLSSLEDPDQSFIVANTHWSYRTEHAGGNTYLTGSAAPIAANELRLQCKEETNAFLSTLKKTYPDTPIFLTGDFNTSLSFFTDSGWTPESFRVISQEALKAGKAISRVPASGHYDHLFGTGSYTIYLYGLVGDSQQHSALTDHPFAYVDLGF